MSYSILQEISVDSQHKFSLNGKFSDSPKYRQDLRPLLHSLPESVIELINRLLARIQQLEHDLEQLGNGLAFDESNRTELEFYKYHNLRLRDKLVEHGIDPEN